MDESEASLGHVAAAALGVDILQIDEEGAVLPVRRQPERDHGVAGDLQVGVERLGGVGEHAGVHRAAIVEVQDRVPHLGHPAVGGTGGGARVNRVVVAARGHRGRIVGQPTLGVQVQRGAPGPGRRPHLGVVVGLFAQVEEAHRGPVVHAVVLALEVVVEEEASQFHLLRDRGIGRKRLRTHRVGAGVVCAPVRRGQDQHLLRVAEVTEAQQRPVGGPRVHPTDQHQHGNARRLDLVPPVDRADLRPALVAADHVVAILGGQHRLEDIRVGGVLGHGRRQERSILIFVNAPDADVHRLDVVVVHQAHQIAPGLDEAARQQAVGANRARVGVEVGPSRDHRLDGRVVHGGQQLGGGAGVRGSVGADRPVRPRSRHHPFHHVVGVQDLLATVLDGAGAERGAAAARVHLDQGVAVGEEVAVQVRESADPLAGRGILKPAAIPGQREERGVRRDVVAAGQVHVGGEAGAVLGRDVVGGDRLRRGRLGGVAAGKERGDQAERGDAGGGGRATECNQAGDRPRANRRSQATRHRRAQGPPHPHSGTFIALMIGTTGSASRSTTSPSFITMWIAR